MNQKELLEKKNDLVTRAEETLNKAKAENRELTDAEMAELAEIRDNVRKIVKALDIEDFFDREGRNNGRKPMPTPPVENSEVMDEDTRAGCGKDVKETRAFENYIRGIVTHERDNNMTFGDNGAVVPTTIANRIIKKVYNICPILERSTKYNVKGTLELPYYDTNTTTITVAYKDEFSALTSASGTFNTISLTGYLAGALTKISRSLINNSQFDIVAFVVDEMSYAIKRFIEKELLNGTPGNPPTTPSKVLGLYGLTNYLTAASQTVITADEVVQLHDKIKDEFQENAMWIMSPATRTALRLLKGTTGYYLLNDDISSPFGTTLLGKPVYVSDNMPDMAAGKNAIFYGDFRGLATKFNEELSIEVLREKYADEHAVGVIGWFEFDSKVEDAQKIAKLVMASA
jgi:HK97 family phage major capsid protein